MANATDTKISALEIIAVSKVIKEKAEKEARAELTVGTHAVNTWVHIVGDITVGADYDQQIWQTSKPMALLALLADKVNENVLKSVFSEYIAGLDNADVMKALEEKGKELKERTDEAIKAVKGETTQNCKGKVTTKLVIENAGGARV